MQKKIGNLFDSTDEAYAHCVAADLYMGRGIAFEFKRLFGGVELLKLQRAKIGQVASQTVDYQDRKLLIFYLVTKQISKGKPTFEDFCACLEQLKAQCLERGVKTLSIPKIGCGLDRLDFQSVVEAIRRTFDGTGIIVTMYFMSEDRDYYLA